MCKENVCKYVCNKIQNTSMNCCFGKEQKSILPDKKNLQMVLGMLKYRKDIKGEKENGGMIIYLMSRKLTDLCWLMLY